MSVIDATAREWAMELEKREMARSGVRLPQARAAVARRLNVSPGTMEGIRRGRGKGMRAWLVDRIQAAFIREIESEISRLTHVLEIARQTGMDARSSEVGSVETELAALRELVG